MGQDDSLMRQICGEIETDLSLNFDKGMVLNIESTDKSIRFFGAAAMAVREIEYMTATWSWLRSQNIGGDVGPGSMPPSRAQIKRHSALEGIKPKNINANMDDIELVVKYLEENGVSRSIAQDFGDDLLFARKHGPSGATFGMIKALLQKHNLTDSLEIQGHGHLVSKLTLGNAKPKTTNLLTWLNPVEATEDSRLAVSDAVLKADESSSELTSEALLTTLHVKS